MSGFLSQAQIEERSELVSLQRWQEDSSNPVPPGNPHPHLTFLPDGSQGVKIDPEPVLGERWVQVTWSLLFAAAVHRTYLKN